MRDAMARSRAFDAAGASGLAFLQSQLELIDTDLVRPLTSVYHKRDIKMKLGGGFPQFISAYASNYATTGNRYFGLQGTNNTDIPQGQVDVQKAVWRTYNWSMGVTITWIDLKRMETAMSSGQPAPFSLQELYEECVETNWVKALDYVVYAGFLGDPGLVNNPNVPETTVATGSTGYTTWKTKTQQEILNDVNTLLNLTVSNSGYDIQEGMADRMLVPFTQFIYLTQPMAVGATPVAMSTIEYIEKNCVAAHHGIPFKIHPLPDTWLSGIGTGTTDRAVIYRSSDKSQYLPVPSPQQQSMSVPTTKDGGAYETLYVGNIGQVVFKRTTTTVYGDGI